MIIVGAVRVLSWAYRALTFTNRKGRKYIMNVEEIKRAVDSGKRVYSGNKNYVVICDSIGQYLIKCTFNDSCIGLTWKDGVTLNGDPDEFWVESPSKYGYSMCNIQRSSFGG